MALERHDILKEAHTRAITAVAYNPVRREIVVGCEDGTIKMLDIEGGKQTNVSNIHRGWVTDFLYWEEQKLFMSSANDGAVVVWSAGAQVCDKVDLHSPVYCMAINRRQQLVCGMNSRIAVFAINPDRESGHIIDALQAVYVAYEHTDIVKRVVCMDSRVYSVGYDAKLVIYDCSYTHGSKCLQPIRINKNAHDAGISHLNIAKDLDNTWVLTGSFDKTVKIWSIDGKLVHKLPGFVSAITGVCYMPTNKTVWVACGATGAQLYDPRSGDNISDYIGTFAEEEEDFSYNLHLVHYIKELKQVVATTSRRQLIIWKYNNFGCITALRNEMVPVESITYTAKRPVLLFSGDHGGTICKWEQLQSNNFMYSSEAFQLTEVMLKRMRKSRKLSDKEKMDLKNHLNMMKMKEMERWQKKNKKEAGGNYAYKKPDLGKITDFNHQNRTILATVFVEEFDLIFAASEDSNIYMWGFDESAVAVLQDLKAKSSFHEVGSHTNRYSILQQKAEEVINSDDLEKIERVRREEESVSNRVAGFVCKFILSEHKSCVTSLCVVPPTFESEEEGGRDLTYLLSGGWDHRICIWEVMEGRLIDIFTDTSFEHQDKREEGELKTSEWAADGIITGIAYNPRDNEFAYSSSDCLAYIRTFSPHGSQMPLVNTLKHDSEVTCIKWNPTSCQWVTGSEDGTIKVWAGRGMNECLQTLAGKDAVTCLCIDKNNGAIIAGLLNRIKVFDCQTYRLKQTNVGHTDAVRDIAHVVEKQQYVSCSWDRTIRIWNEWRKPIVREQPDATKLMGSRSRTVTPEGSSVHGDSVDGDSAPSVASKSRRPSARSASMSDTGGDAAGHGEGQPEE